MKRICFLGITVLFISSGYTQNDYTRLKNIGQLPEAVITPSVEKYKESLENVDENLKKTDQKTQEQYYLESSFSIDDMMRSGIVLFNDEYNQYLEHIADLLLVDYPELRSKVHFYLLRSPVVNAFAAGEGNIFISMGLISMLENESQLAFVMGHEIGHIAEEHGLDFYMKATAIDKSGADRRIMKNGSFDERMIAKNLYSQSLETEADAFGIKVFLTTEYSTSMLNGVFDVLKYAYLPYEDLAFEKSFFETEYYVVSNNLMLDSVKPISGEPEIAPIMEKLRSTHPSIGERRAAVLPFIDSTDTGTKKFTLVSEDLFLKLRNAARYELPMFYLHNQFYQDAIYASYLGLQVDSSNTYLKKVIAKSLTCLAKFRNSPMEYGFAERMRYTEIEGEQEQLYYMLQNMSNAELTVVALEYTYDLHLQLPQDPELLPLCKLLMKDLVRYHFDDEKEFIKTMDISRDSLQALADKNVIKIVPYDPTEKKTTGTSSSKKSSYKKTTTTTTKIENTKSHLMYAFNAFWDNKEFQDMWKDAVAERKTELRESEYALKSYEPYKKTTLGVEKVVVMNPFYLRVDERKENAVEYVSSEEGEIRFVNILQENAKLLGVNLQIIDPLLMKEGDADQFNDMASLDDWFNEQLDFGSLDLPGHSQAVIDSIADKYGTEYFLWTGILSMQQENNVLLPSVYMLGSIFFPLLLPYGIYELATPEYEFFYLAILYNVKTYESTVIKYQFLPSDDSKAILNSQTYDMLYEITTKPGN